MSKRSSLLSNDSPHLVQGISNTHESLLALARELDERERYNGKRLMDMEITEFDEAPTVQPNRFFGADAKQVDPNNVTFVNLIAPSSQPAQQVPVQMPVQQTQPHQRYVAKPIGGPLIATTAVIPSEHMKEYKGDPENTKDEHKRVANTCAKCTLWTLVGIVGLIVVMYLIVVTTLHAFPSSYRNAAASYGGVYPRHDHPYAALSYDSFNLEGMGIPRTARLTGLRIMSSGEKHHNIYGFRNASMITAESVVGTISLAPLVFYGTAEVSYGNLENVTIQDVYVDTNQRHITKCEVSEKFTDPKTGKVDWYAVSSYMNRTMPLENRTPSSGERIKVSKPRVYHPSSKGVQDDPDALTGIPWPDTGPFRLRVPQLQIKNATKHAQCVHMPSISAVIDADVERHARNISVTSRAMVKWSEHVHEQLAKWLKRVAQEGGRKSISSDEIKVQLKVRGNRESRGLVVTLDADSPIGKASARVDASWESLMVWSHRNLTEALAVLMGKEHWRLANLTPDKLPAWAVTNHFKLRQAVAHFGYQKGKERLLSEESFTKNAKPKDVCAQTNRDAIVHKMKDFPVADVPLILPVKFALNASADVVYIDTFLRSLHVSNYNGTRLKGHMGHTHDIESVGEFVNELSLDGAIAADGVVAVHNFALHNKAQTIDASVLHVPYNIEQSRVSLHFGGFLRGIAQIQHESGGIRFAVDVGDYDGKSKTLFSLGADIRGSELTGEVGVHDVAVCMYNNPMLTGSMDVDVRRGNLRAEFSGAGVLTASALVTMEEFELRKIQLNIIASHGKLASLAIEYSEVSSKLDWKKGEYPTFHLAFKDARQDQVLAKEAKVAAERDRVIHALRTMPLFEVQGVKANAHPDGPAHHATHNMTITDSAVSGHVIVVLYNSSYISATSTVHVGMFPITPDNAYVTAAVASDIHVVTNQLYMPQAAITKSAIDIKGSGFHINTPKKRPLFLDVVLYRYKHRIPYMRLDVAMETQTHLGTGYGELDYEHEFAANAPADVEHKVVVTGHATTYDGVGTASVKLGINATVDDIAKWRQSRIPPFEYLVEKARLRMSTRVDNLRLLSGVQLRALDVTSTGLQKVDVHEVRTELVAVDNAVHTSGRLFNHIVRRDDGKIVPMVLYHLYTQTCGDKACQFRAPSSAELDKPSLLDRAALHAAAGSEKGRAVVAAHVSGFLTWAQVLARAERYLGLVWTDSTERAFEE